MPKAPKTATTRKRKAASVPDTSYTRKVQVVREVVNIPKVIHGRVPNLVWQLGQIGSQVGTQVGPQVGPKLATVNHPIVGLLSNAAGEMKVLMQYLLSSSLL